VITKFTATDRKTAQYVHVVGGYFSVNGTEPIKVPEEYREMDARAIARTLLRKLIQETQ
jgi:hypothetical protein